MFILKKYDISKFLNQFEEFQQDTTWYYAGEQIVIRSEVELEDKLTDIMRALYDQTPEIRNEMINRRKLNGLQTRAVHTVLNHVIKYPTVEHFKLEGQGPDYLVYATVFKNNQLDVNNLNTLSNEPYRALRNSLIAYIIANPKGTAVELEHIFTSTPFGIRKPLIPLLFVGLLRDYWDQLMFYRNDMFITGIDAEKLYGIFSEPNAYQYEFYHYSEGFLKFTNELESHFRPYISEYVLDQTPVIRASSGVLNWLRQLPRHTQMTNRLGKSLLEFKDLIRKVEVSPLMNLQKLMKKYDLGKIMLHKIYLENYFEMFKSETLQVLFDVFQVDTIDALQKKHSAYLPVTLKNNRMLKNMDFSATDFIAEFALQYTGLELENWSDTTFELFVKQVGIDYQESLISKEEIDVDTITFSYNDKKKVLKKVELSSRSKSIYENVERMIQTAGRSVSREEVEYLIFKLIEDFIE